MIYNIKNEYRTPIWLFDTLNRIFDYTLDAAANEINHLCAKYYTMYDNGLKQSWENEVVFCNPPFTKGEYSEWIDKGSTEFLNNAVSSTFILPFNVETAGFGPIWDTPAHYLIIPYRRINFLLPSGAQTQGVKFMTCIAIFTYRTLLDNELDLLHKRIGRVLDLYTGLHTYTGNRIV